MPIFWTQCVAGTHPRGHVQRLNIRVFNDRKHRWNAAPAVFEKDKPDCLLRASFAKRLGLSGPYVQATIQLLEYHRHAGGEVTTDIPLRFRLVDDDGFANYQQLAPERINIVLGQPLVEFLESLNSRRSAYRLHFNTEKVRCVPFNLPG